MQVLLWRLSGTMLLRILRMSLPSDHHPGCMLPSLSSAPCKFVGRPKTLQKGLTMHCRAAVPIQHFMAWRIMRFSKSPVLFIYVSLLSLTQGALGCASATMGLLSPSIASHVKIIPVADAWLAMSVACDMSITYVYPLHCFFSLVI